MKYSTIIRRIVDNPHQPHCPLCSETMIRNKRCSVVEDKYSCENCPARFEILGAYCGCLRNMLRGETETGWSTSRFVIKRRGAREMALELALACELAGD